MRNQRRRFRCQRTRPTQPPPRAELHRHPRRLDQLVAGRQQSVDAMGTNNISSFSPTIYAPAKWIAPLASTAFPAAFKWRPPPPWTSAATPTSRSKCGSNAGSSNSTNPNVPLLEKRAPARAGRATRCRSTKADLHSALGSLPQSPTNVSSFVSSGPDLRDGMFHHVAVSVERTIRWAVNSR